MKVAVIGLGFGDEGKGLVTNWLAQSKKYNLVNRYCGGHQAGHTVRKDYNKSHVFQNYGSGTLQGLPTYWNTLIDPLKVLKERDILKDKFDISPRMYVNKSCPITTPFDVIANINRANKDTVGQGIGETYQRQNDGYLFTVEDLFYHSVYKIKLQEIEYYYQTKFPKYNFEIGSLLNICNNYEKFIDLVCLCEPPKDDIIYESSQGLLLDEKIGFYPYVTWGELGSKNINVDSVYYVTRAYQTRHGLGPMSNSIKPDIIIPNYETNIENKFQGKFRTSILDIDLLEYAIDKDDFKGERNLVITCLDHINSKHSLIHNGKFHTFNSRNKFLEYITKRVFFDLDNFFISTSPFSENIHII